MICSQHIPRFHKFILLLLVLCVSAQLIFVILDSNGKPIVVGKLNRGTAKEQAKVVVLLWTTYFELKGNSALAILGINNHSYPECFQNCEITYSRSRLEEADAVLFHAWPEDLNEKDLPPARRPSQVWIWFNQEAPILTPVTPPFDQLFNWTMTYRRDSDVYHPYGKIVPASSVDIRQIEAEIANLTSGKSKLAAGVISKCSTNSHRERLISKLKAYGVKGDIYGKCGASTCEARNGCSASQFWAQLSHRYKFYFAFENALCSDYVTEKLFRTLELGLVPVVYGGANYSVVAPPNSFIDVTAFESWKEVAEYLLKLDKSPAEYKKYFEWKKKYTVAKGDGFCTLCRQLQIQRLSNNNARRVYKNLTDWWLKYPPPVVEDATSAENEVSGKMMSSSTPTASNACSMPPL